MTTITQFINKETKMTETQVQKKFDKLLGMRSEKKGSGTQNLELVYRSPNGFELVRFKFAYRKGACRFYGYTEGFQNFWEKFVKMGV
jgi:hypothetical protein